MSDLLELPPGDVKGHAARVSSIGDDMQEGIDACNQVSIGDNTEAFGIINQWLPPILQIPEAGVVAMLTGVQSTFPAAAATLNMFADDVTSTDGDNADDIDGTGP